ncbi:asparagine synthase (glutamine-hydrolyzing) [Shewanella sp. 202IG2-18]|uniref:asparagine synthase (glutamine-hydrolyzing) n=1 Tax=Parashewanella hymeniacidonis TaxID=2807618 RepID=UPI0019618A98|nr:asparagine synthase (glutamine-hydrolyzing) [Parashewanella hymeniacidonis]MBM7071453.1 asparagine synthase (glutamine-hydrolyzing) [Parashewanella hymeniacidonis]
MCGFLCAFAPTNAIDKQSILNGINAIQHRGPDEVGHWGSFDNRIHLGHARLSIIDLNQGHQPLTNQDQSIVAVVNGEFYDYKRIARELILEGYKFKTHSDSEILVHLYQKYGSGCFEHLRGEFAFVLWDKNNNQIFAGRDRFGIKPLFYYQDKKNIYFASEMKAFKPLGLPLSWNKANFLQEKSLFHIADHSLIENIRELPASHYLTKAFDSDKLSIKQYWDIEYLSTKAQKQYDISEAEAVQGFREKFDEAVKFRLNADVPVGCYLSGGIDSSAILGAAQQHYHRPITAFTLSFDDQSYDESVYAKETAKFTGSHYVEVPVTAMDIVDNFEDSVYKGEKLIFNCNAVSKHLLSKHVQQHGFKVVLTGEGSDEFLAGYASFRQDYLAHYMDEMSAAQKQEVEVEFKNANKVSQGLLIGKQNDPAMNTAQRILGYQPNWMSAFTYISAASKQIFNDDYLNFVKDSDPIANLLHSLPVKEKLLGRGILHQSLYLWTRSMLPHYLLTLLGDRMEMAHSIEGRVPFLDHKLTEYVARLPEHFKIRGMKEKYLLREAAKPVLTDTMYKRMKHPFLSPPSKNNRSQLLNEFLLDKIHSQSMRNLPFYDQQKLIQFAESSDDNINPTQRDVILMQAVSACILGEKLGLNSI